MPDSEPGDAEDLAWRERQRVAQTDTGYSVAWTAIQPLFERIDALVGPFMATPAQTLEALVLKRRIGFVFDHFEEDAIDDLDRLARAGAAIIANTAKAGA